MTDNPVLLDLDGLRRIWIPRETPQYYPLVFTTFWLEHKVWSFEPAGYHLVNILLHAFSALLVWRVCWRIGIPGGLASAWLIAAVFALHPVHVESVAWISERKNVLSGFLYLLAMLAYLRFDERRIVPGRPSAETWRWYGAALLLFVLALLSKTVTCSLPAALILIMLFQRTPMNLRRLAPLAPFFIIGLCLGLFTAYLERAGGGRCLRILRG